MSMAERERLASHPNLFYTDEATQKADILREGKPGETFSGMQSEAIAYLLYVVDAGFVFCITMAQTGHHDDGSHGHAGGYCFDGAFLASQKAGDWLPAPSDRFDAALEHAGQYPGAYQIGLVGDSGPGDAYDDAAAFHYAEKGFTIAHNYTPGVSVFQDGGGAHIHLGARGNW